MKLVTEYNLSKSQRHLTAYAKDEKVRRSYENDNHKSCGIKSPQVNILFRGSVVFDECGFLSDEMIDVYGAFAIVNKNLKTGKDSSGRSIDPIRQRCFPNGMPYQKIYISSASSADTKFAQLYREFAKKRIMGDPD